ncbi:MAG: flagellar biosynthetic protein FliO [Bryobacter sp.]|jgi:flagellar biogenesis protein FliO|nr:flagellar biosynthetic protein FliO [Bryobacter sp.]
MDGWFEAAAAAGVLLMLGATMFLLRRRGWIAPAASAGLLRPVASVRLTAQHSLHLVEVDGRRVLVAAHPAGCALLETRPAAEGARA